MLLLINPCRNFNNKVLEILNKTKKANIVVLENEKCIADWCFIKEKDIEIVDR